MKRLFGSGGTKPSQGDLTDLFTRVALVEIFARGIMAARLGGEQVLYASADPLALRDLEDALAIVPGGTGHCLCRGDLILALTDAHGSRLADISVHHGTHIRWARWRYDADLRDGDRLVDWLYERGVQVPLEEGWIRQRSVQHIQRYLGKSVERRDRGLFQSADKRVAFSLGCAEPAAAVQPPRYLFSVRGDQVAYLEQAEQAYCAFVCGWMDRIVMLPYERFTSLFARGDITLPADAAHSWTILISHTEGGLVLHSPGAREPLNVAEFLVPRIQAPA